LQQQPLQQQPLQQQPLQQQPLQQQPLQQQPFQQQPLQQQPLQQQPFQQQSLQQQPLQQQPFQQQSLQPRSAAPAIYNGPTHGISQKQVAEFMTMCTPGSRPIISCRLAWDWEFLFIVIPLWFNVTWTYLIISDRSLAICNRTLWRGCYEAHCFEPPMIEQIVFHQSKKTFGKRFVVSLQIVGSSDSEDIEMDAATFDMFESQAAQIKHVFPNTHFIRE
ncbi:MAG: hypothetical protein HOH50_08195, partial [Planctomycetaceae bacterium]|nr:hypothetical protein [Planctomycetaceae bacterium]